MSSNHELKVTIDFGPLNKLTLKPTINGKKASPFSPQLPHELRDFMKRSFSYGLKEDQLLRFLQSSEPEYPFEINVNRQTYSLFWKNDESYFLLYDFQASDEEIKIKRSSSIYGTVIRISDYLAVSLDQQCLLPLVSHSDSYDELTKRLVSTALINDTTEDVFTHPVSVFNAASFCIEETSHALFSSENTQQDLKISSPTIEVTVTETEQSDFLIKPECKTGSFSTGFDRFLVEELLHCSSLPESFVTQDRLVVIQALLLDCLTDSSSLEHLETKISESASIRTDDNIRLVADYIRSLLKKYAVESSQVQFSSGQWVGVTMDRLIQAKLILTFRKILGSTSTFSPQHQGFIVYKETFQDAVHDLQNILNEMGIELTFNKKKIELIDWDVEVFLDSVTATPRFMIDSKNVDSEALKIALNQTWFDQADGDNVTLIDEQTRMKLKALLEIQKLHESPAKKSVQQLENKRHYSLIDWIFLEKLGVRVNLPPELQAVYQRLLSMDRIQRYPLSPSVSLVPRHYQEEGYFWLCFLYEHHLGGVLADDMGLGKTLQAIMLLVAVKENILSRKAKPGAPNIIVVPPSLIYNWKIEIEKVSSIFSIDIYAGSDRVYNPSVDIIITTYDIVRMEQDSLSEKEFNVLIIDEAQLVKNQGAARTVAIQKLKSEFTLCLTGTPLENHLGEYFTILNIALPGIMSASELVDDNHQLLLKRATPFVLRRMKDMIFDELPPKQEIEVFLDFSEKQRQFYSSLLQEVQTQLKSVANDSSKRNAVTLTALLRLRQACISPGLLGITSEELSPKFKYLLQNLEELHEENHSCLVFSQFTSCLDLLEPLLKEKNLPYLRLDGKTSVSKRKELVDRFQNSEEPLIFLMSLKAGGVGLNLTRASYVFHLDPWWNPAAERQASDRAHRIGQKQTVMIMHLVIKDSVEEKVLRLKQEKNKLFETIFEDKQAYSGKLTREDFEFLLS